MWLDLLSQDTVSGVVPAVRRVAAVVQSMVVLMSTSSALAWCLVFGVLGTLATGQSVEVLVLGTNL